MHITVTITVTTTVTTTVTKRQRFTYYRIVTRYTWHALVCTLLSNSARLSNELHSTDDTFRNHVAMTDWHCLSEFTSQVRMSGVFPALYT